MFSSPWIPIIGFLTWGLVVFWKATVPWSRTSFYRPLNYDDRPPSPSHFFAANVIAFLACILVEIVIRRWTVSLSGKWLMWPVMLCYLLSNTLFPLMFHRVVDNVPRVLEIAFVCLHFLSAARCAVKKDNRSAIISLVIGLSLCWPNLSHVAMFVFILGGIMFEPYTGTALAPAWHGLVFLMLIFQVLFTKELYTVLHGQELHDHLCNPMVLIFFVFTHAWVTQNVAHS